MPVTPVRSQRSTGCTASQPVSGVAPVASSTVSRPSLPIDSTTSSMPVLPVTSTCPDWTPTVTAAVAGAAMPSVAVTATTGITTRGTIMSTSQLAEVVCSQHLMWRAVQPSRPAPNPPGTFDGNRFGAAEAVSAASVARVEAEVPLGRRELRARDPAGRDHDRGVDHVVAQPPLECLGVALAELDPD